MPSAVPDPGAALAPARRGGAEHVLLRELAAAHRCDAVVTCSSTEARALHETYGIRPDKVCLASYFYDVPSAASSGFSSAFRPVVRPAAGDRSDFCGSAGFCAIGNFLHAPNADAFEWLVRRVWPRVRASLRGSKFQREDSEPTLTLYGAGLEGKGGAARRAALHDPARGVFVEGRAASLEVLRRHRVCLAPVRFGAGVKGKILDAWAQGRPVVATPVGAEGVEPVDGSATEPGPRRGWGGLCGSASARRFASDCVALHEDFDLWAQSVRRGRAILDARFSRARNARAIVDLVDGWTPGRREGDLSQALLSFHGARSAEYLSRWIEAKERADAGGQ
jgi:hypothetical protein